MNHFSNGPSTPSNQKKNSSSAVAITVVICILLAVGAVLISVLNPRADFDFIPSIIGPSKVHYADMEYERPDGEVIIKDMDELIDLITVGKSFTEQSRVFTRINENIINYRTMMSLAEIRYYTDTSDDFYKEENELLRLEYVDIYDKTGELLDVIEASTFKQNYERSFFGLGYFNDWIPMKRSEAAGELMTKEQELISEYQDAISNAFVTYEGREIRVPSEEFYALDVIDMDSVIALYRDKYNKELGELYAELVKVRLALAEELGTDYISLAYDDLGRDFTPEQADAYIDGVVDGLLPNLSKYDADVRLLKERADTLSSFYSLSLAASRMGGDVEEAFDYMVKYGLYELSASDGKQGISFETFLEKYYSPFMFVSSEGTAYDFITYAHEFGHFVDDYVNLGASKTIDTAEIASQALAYIAPFYSDGVNGIDSDKLLKINLYSTFELYSTTAFIHRFETAVYSLEPSEVTPERLTELAKEAALSVGMSEAEAATMSVYWFEVQHLYIAPMYYVGYAISNDVAIQAIEAELNAPGKGGIEAFERIIKRDPYKTFEENIVNAGFESPFADGRAESLAEFIDGVFFPNATEKVEESTAESLPDAA